MFRYYLLGGDTAAPSGLYARLCHAFLVSRFNSHQLHTHLSYRAYHWKVYLGSKVRPAVLSHSLWGPKFKMGHVT